MDLNKLNLASTESLTKLRDAVDAVLASRLDTRLLPGRVGEFQDRDGRTRFLMIDKINGKTVSGTETGRSINPGGKWRVGKSQIKVEPVAKIAPGPTVKFTAPHKPRVDDAW